MIQFYVISSSGNTLPRWKNETNKILQIVTMFGTKFM